LKQINYFKFLEKFPELIDFDDDVSVKLALLAYLRKRYWRKKDNDIPRLLPVALTTKILVSCVREKGFDKYHYGINFRNERIFSMSVSDYPSIPVHFQKSLRYRYGTLKNIKIMEREEIINLKRTLLINEMTK